MAKDITIIDNSHDHECYCCLGKGQISPGSVLSRTRKGKSVKLWITCPTCKGTGKWREEHFYLIDNKHKIAFDVDSPGK